MLRGICEVSVVSGKRKAVKFDLFSLSTYMCRLCHNVGIFSMIILYSSQHIYHRADVLMIITWYVLMGPVQFQH